jgi:Common central domain of tyrosinase
VRVAGTRRDIDTLSEEELGDYIHALDVLRRRSAENPDDVTGYDFQAALHNDGAVGPCEHGNDRFFPWHRAHLHYFELLLQGADPPRTANVTIPYWDWIHPQEGRKFPLAFDLPGLFSDGRNPDTKVGLPSDTLEIVTGERSWPEFGGYPENGPTSGPKGNFGRLERGPHNIMHNTFIDGRMGNPATAAEDPIYFSFHAFIDLLWFEWQRRNDMPPPTSPEVKLRGFSDQPKHLLGDFADPVALQLDYEYTDKLNRAFEVAPFAPARELHRLLTAEPLSPRFLEPVSEALRSEGGLEFTLPAVEEAPATVVRLQLNIPTTGSYTVFGYLHPSQLTFAPGDPAFVDSWRVGYAAVWVGHGSGDDDHAGHAHHPSSMIVRFDVTDVLASVDDPSDLVLTLDWVPAPNQGRAEEVAPRLAEEIDIEALELERFE